jgi:hypothetical protein
MLTVTFVFRNKALLKRWHQLLRLLITDLALLASVLLGASCLRSFTSLPGGQFFGLAFLVLGRKYASECSGSECLNANALYKAGNEK